MNKYRKARNNVTYTINKTKTDFYYKAIKSSRSSKIFGITSGHYYHLKKLAILEHLNCVPMISISF